MLRSGELAHVGRLGDRESGKGRIGGAAEACKCENGGGRLHGEVLCVS